MVGSILRVSANSSVPTGTAGTNPFAFQATIATVTSTTSLAISAGPSQAFSGAGYYVADPVDVIQHMYDAFLRNCEKQLAFALGLKDADAIERRYIVALQKAKSADSVVNQRMIAGEETGPMYRVWQEASQRNWI
jgi:hypothetical protein